MWKNSVLNLRLVIYGLTQRYISVLVTNFDGKKHSLWLISNKLRISNEFSYSSGVQKSFYKKNLMLQFTIIRQIIWNINVSLQWNWKDLSPRNNTGVCNFKVEQCFMRFLQIGIKCVAESRYSNCYFAVVFFQTIRQISKQSLKCRVVHFFKRITTQSQWKPTYHHYYLEYWKHPTEKTNSGNK